MPSKRIARPAALNNIGASCGPKAFLITLVALAAVLFHAHGVAAATLVVPDGFKTIREAVDAAAPGDTVTVKPGKYSENVVIKRPVAIIATSGPEGTKVTAAEAGESVFKAVDVSGMTISGFTVTGSAVAGIFLNNVSDSTVSGNALVENNTGIIMVRSRNNTISANNADRNWIEGISIDSSSGNRIENNTANENSEKGIFVNNSDDNSIVGNNANLNTWNGITIYSSDRNVIKDNMTLRNTFGLVISDSKENIETNNTTVPNIFIIFPVLLVYIGIVVYLVQKNIFKIIYRAK